MEPLSIVLVAYNPTAHLASCLDSIFIQKFSHYKIIAVDNTPNGEASRLIRSHYPGVELIENRKNVGPSMARNQGIARSDGEFILCLDDDVILQEHFLSNIYDKINADMHLGAVQPKILMMDKKTIYSAGIRVSFLRRFCDIGSGRQDNGEYNNQKAVFGASSAAVIYRRKALESIRQEGEYFDSDLFYLFEDVDLSWRLQKKGWQIMYYPEASCYHRGGGSRSKNNFSQYLCFRNRYLILAKNDSFTGFLRLLAAFVVYDLWRGLSMLFLNTGYFFRACYELAVYLPKMLKKRGYAQSNV
ncbi:MAG: glycosyltransferase family 2 protein [Candidatus Omnitrophica bacterium]|nr:glycosyltransferase family 2 protein [Candidatus Omnitrophota bacterium]